MLHHWDACRLPWTCVHSTRPVLDENLEHAAAGGHKAAAYVAAILLYMANGGAGIDATARQYMRQAAMGEEDSVAAPEGGGVTMWLDRCWYFAISRIKSASARISL